MSRKKRVNEPQTIEEYGKDTSRDHKCVSVREAEAKFIKFAYNVGGRWERYAVNATMPDGAHLFNGR